MIFTISSNIHCMHDIINKGILSTSIVLLELDEHQSFNIQGLGHCSMYALMIAGKACIQTTWYLD